MRASEGGVGGVVFCRCQRKKAVQQQPLQLTNSGGMTERLCVCDSVACLVVWKPPYSHMRVAPPSSFSHSKVKIHEGSRALYPWQKNGQCRNSYRYNGTFPSFLSFFHLLSCISENVNDCHCQIRDNHLFSCLPPTDDRFTC